MHCDLEKLDMYGTDYIFTLATEGQKNELYQLYMSESSKLLLEITARLGGSKIEFPRYMDLMNPKPREPEKTAEEIVMDVTKNAGLEVID